MKLMKKGFAMIMATVAFSALSAEKITVLPVENLSSDFIMGVDTSSMIALEDSGVAFYDKDGNKQDVLELLKAGGANCVRIRVWNEPRTKNGKTYGAGNNDIDTAVKIVKRAKKAGLDVLIDFHYSDFWADPGKQAAPKAWKDFSLEQKKGALIDFTRASLAKIKAETGVVPKMVQVGNEINNGMSGERTDDGIYTLVKAGADAVRAFDPSILIAIHYTDPTRADFLMSRARLLDKYGVDYDVLATSYYPFWHGELDKLEANLTQVRETFGKKVMVAETSYPFTDSDGDGYGNVATKASSTSVFKYPFTVEGQAIAVRDVINAVSNAGGIGVFYWEPAWIPVRHYEASAKNAKSVLKTNRNAWDKLGAGWATAAAKEYDPEVHDKYNGGTWDNQALFDYDGKALESINVFNYARTGSKGALRVVRVEEAKATFKYGAAGKLPDTVNIVYNDGSIVAESVEWDKKEAEKVLSNPDFGEYKVTGKLKNGESALCTVIVTANNLLSNGSFEDGNLNGWTVENPDSKGSPKIEKSSDNASSGLAYFSLWDEKGFDVSLNQTVENVEAGKYKCFATFQGTGVKESSTVELVVTVNENGEEKVYRSPVSIANEWKKFSTAEVPFDIAEIASVNVRIVMRAKAKENGVWLVCDDVRLFSVE